MTILDEHGQPVTFTAEQWMAKLRDLYARQGIDVELEEHPEGIVANLGDVEMTHTIGHPDVDKHVVIAAEAMRRGPLYLSPKGTR